MTAMMRTRLPPNRPRRCVGASFLAGAIPLALVACGDGEFDDPVESGGGAGDATENAVVIAPYAGTWNLTGSWRGVADDAAWLEIEAPGEDGESVARLQDLDEIGGCYERAFRGTVSVDPLGFGVFLSDLLVFEEAVLTLADNETTLLIEHTDVEDVDGDGNLDERVITRAVRDDGLTDFGPTC